MRRMITAAQCVCGLLMALLVGGCDGVGNGPDATSSTTTGQVKGKVTLGGQPLTNAEVRFNPSNVNRKDATVVNGSIKEDGTYEVTTLIGQNQVSLTGPGVGKTPQLAYFSKTLDVKAGANEFDITIP